MAHRVEGINPTILIQCREQIGLTLSEVEAKVPKIRDIEHGELKPTFKQIDALSALYSVPRWVFISDEIPAEYRFDRAIPAFRQFSHSGTATFGDARLRRVVARVERYRQLMLDLSEDVEDSGIFETDPPMIDKSEPADQAARKTIEWLAPPRPHLGFEEWRELIEQRGVFVFVTSKYRGWSNIDDLNLRGVSLYHDQLPVIIINDSDAKKAQSFTLFHELGHILRRENALDKWDGESSRTIERWCDAFAGSVLMPVSGVLAAVPARIDLDSINRVARSFKVSSYAMLVRFLQLGIVNRGSFYRMQNAILEDYAQQKLRLSRSEGGPTRNVPKEVLTQFGRMFTSVVFQAYNDREIGLHKTSTILGLKRPSQAMEVRALL
ncbi:MAG: ImmA/IrrE family metallo-endopeptidase [Spirochaetaceae bacterium]|nr:MAG: ImmA/IrrE family metallo-endopeptidase [Spirochaetaceae bacterium]